MGTVGPRGSNLCPPPFWGRKSSAVDSNCNEDIVRRGAMGGTWVNYVPGPGFIEKEKHGK